MSNVSKQNHRFWSREENKEKELTDKESKILRTKKRLKKPKQWSRNHLFLYDLEKISSDAKLLFFFFKSTPRALN